MIVAPFLEAHIGMRAEVADARIVDQYVEPAIHAVDFARRSEPIVLGRDVQPVARCRWTSRVQSSQALLELVRRAIGEHDSGAFLRETLGRRPADPGGGAGNECDLRRRQALITFWSQCTPQAHANSIALGKIEQTRELGIAPAQDGVDAVTNGVVVIRRRDLVKTVLAHCIEKSAPPLHPATAHEHRGPKQSPVTPEFRGRCRPRGADHSGRLRSDS